MITLFFTLLVLSLSLPVQIDYVEYNIPKLLPTSWIQFFNYFMPYQRSGSLFVRDLLVLLFLLSLLVSSFLFFFLFFSSSSVSASLNFPPFMRILDVYPIFWSLLESEYTVWSLRCYCLKACKHFLPTFCLIF